MPIHYEDPTHEYKELVMWNLEEGPSAQIGGCPIVITGTSENELSYNVDADCVFTLDSNPEVGRQCVTSSGVVNQMVGVVLFTGLSPSASIILKVISDIEVVPTDTSMLAQTTSDAPLEDAVAMRLTQTVTTGLPMGFPSRYNSIGLIMKAIQPLIKPAMQVAMPWIRDRLAGRVRNIPASSKVQYV
jgi:hypothetical protein